ncbi:two-component system, chemotaxis family, CheB/CheR fusion protein [Nitratiruptor sp. YY08-14]|nr:two-component system, chemotaxis family, CheB/CheR fusion protein [Nitratiruptor sp. YY08-10]BCD64304.1 two-component system, chemotaxis family, CheB/CheR fusion protein [Nitratiruptor sp. YY08-14]
MALGASAGGYEALQEFIKNLDEAYSKDIAFVITQHLDPTHPTLLKDLLSRYTTLPIKMIYDHQKIEPGVIYICPPNNNLTVNEQQEFILTPPGEKGFPKPSINLFLKSLAKHFDGDIVAIVLSGTGSDGAEGIMAVKNAGGITIAQDPKEAKYSSMPQAAIQTGCVDLVLPVKDIAKNLLKILNIPHTIEKETEKSSLETIFDMLQEKFNVDFTDYKIGTIHRRIERRMAVNNVNSLQEYIEILRNNPQELKLLFKDLIIIVTSFFRDKEFWNILEKHIINQMSESQDNDYRVWVPGCATGEEAYSIAMLLDKITHQMKLHKKITIFATDISEEAIRKARIGIFSKDEVENIDDFYLSNYFRKIDNNKYEIIKEIREKIIFSVHDLIKDPPFLNLDLISCRNLLIYFNSTLQNRIINIFHHSLKENGILFLGKSEAISSLHERFIVLDAKARIFKKDPTYKQTDLSALTYYPKRYRNKIVLTSHQNGQKQESTITKEDVLLKSVVQALLKSIFKNIVIINRNNNIIYIGGNANKYLQFPKGNFSNDILTLINNELKFDIRYLISKVRSESISINKRIRYKESENKVKVQYINIMAIPISNQYCRDCIALIFIESSDEVAIDKDIKIDNKDLQQYINDLETELMLTKEQLQTTIEELETSNEELQSANEELQSANEELQSTNEELETSNEELQSTNEELRTVNEELEIKTQQLREKTNDLENIFRILDFGAVIVDKDLKIKNFTHKANYIFNLSYANLHELITTVGTKVDIGNIRPILEQVIETKKEYGFEVKDKNKIFHIKIVPYIDKNSIHKECKGAIIAIYDVTEYRKKEEMLQNYQKKLLIEQEKLKTIIDESQNIILLANRSRIFLANKKFFTFLGIESLEQLKEKKVYELFEEDSPLFQKVEKKGWMDYLKQHPEEAHEVYLKDKDGNKRIFLAKVSQTSIDKKRIVTLTDVTEMKRKDLLLIQQSKLAAMGEMVANIAHQWRQPLNLLSLLITDLHIEFNNNHLTQDKFEEFYEKSNEIIQNMSKTIDDFRNFFSTNKIKLRFKLKELIEDTKKIVLPSLEQNHIALKENIKDIELIGYKSELMQVLINIINNAKDAIKERKIQNGKIIIYNKNEKEYIFLYVQDNGGGIKPEILDKVFEPYFTTKFKSNGTGLGLYMSKMIMEAMKGDISLENEGDGVKVTLKIPKEVQ